MQEKVNKYLKEHGLKKSYLASYIGIHPSQLSGWLTGHLILKDYRIAKIEDFLNGERK